MDDIYLHVCEICGRREMLTAQAAFNEGWDYPPHMGEFGVVSPRVCAQCPTEQTIWWRLMVEQRGEETLNEHDWETLRRIQHEPASILITN